jgi:hypothetical protein
MYCSKGDFAVFFFRVFSRSSTILSDAICATPGMLPTKTPME